MILWSASCCRHMCVAASECYWYFITTFTEISYFSLWSWISWCFFGSWQLQADRAFCCFFTMVLFWYENFNSVPCRCLSSLQSLPPQRMLCVCHLTCLFCLFAWFFFCYFCNQFLLVNSSEGCWQLKRRGFYTMPTRGYSGFMRYFGVYEVAKIMLKDHLSGL